MFISGAGYLVKDPKVEDSENKEDFARSLGVTAPQHHGTVAQGTDFRA